MNSSIDIVTIILDNQLRIALFTPAVHKLFNLIPSDLDRPLPDITHRFQYDKLSEDAANVLETLQTTEQEVSAANGAVYLMRITPYRTSEERIGGVVVTFLDITQRKAAQETLRRSEEKKAFMLQLSDAILPLSRREDIEAALTNLVRRFFQADRCYYAEIAAGKATIRQDAFATGLSSVKGIYDLDAMPLFKAALQQQRPLIVANAATADILDENLRALCRQLQVVSFMHVPVVKQGRAAGLLCIVQSSERSWTDFEQEVAEEIAERAWTALDDARQEQALQESREIFGYFVRDTSDVVFEMSHDWQEMRLLKGNDFLADLSTPQTGWMAAILPADERERVQTAIAQAIQTKTIFELEHQVIGRKGRIGWVLSRAIPLIDSEGRLLKWFGAASKINPQKKATEDLRESEERLRVTMEAAVDYAIIGMDAQGLIESWSRGAEQIFGWQEAEVLGRSGAIIFTQEDIEKGAVEAELSKAVAHGFAPDERWHVRKDGRRFFMSGVVRPIYDGSLRGFVKVAQDLTEQRHSAEVLRLSEERLRIALQSAEMAAWDWNIPADEIIWNEQHYYILGLPVADQFHSVNEFYSYVHPDDRERLQIDMAQALNQTGLIQTEFRIIRKDTQAVRWMNGFGRVINKDSNGAATRMIGVMYDITERRKMEEQKEAFLGIASHELKTPLTSLKAYAEILEEILAEEGSEQSRPLIQKLDAQIDRLTELVRTLLDVTAMRAGKLELRMESFDLCELLRERAGDLTMGTEQQLRLVCVGPIPVLADRERIGQVTTNFLSNAMKYAPGTKEILLDVVAEQTQAVVSVQDFGIGISKPVQARLFQRFYRAGNGGAETFPGLGLGLYIAAEIVQQHGGKIWVESEPGQGSTFYFSLPLPAEKAG